MHTYLFRHLHVTIWTKLISESLLEYLSLGNSRPLCCFAGANAKLRYQITAGNTGGVFDVEPEVGTIFIAQPLDYEQIKRYKLYVLASDGKWEDYTAVVVNVVNKNDEAPVFSVNEYYGSVTEELDGSPVFVLQVMRLQKIIMEDCRALLFLLYVLTMGGLGRYAFICYCE